ncbi:tyrosine-type recombinase/integrase [Rhodoplanes sp. Z2-YC6860]|uniref:tyrosine-type recombinase/integrase n=1 Tax=Rhodoplanes sp. Z2-YC6860 TaxID=674703 RepID=UPI001F011D1C|nr:tyrosine-type recombinase/integrase [Rhodoplanes sp. Z2-YC6860]
MWYVRKARGKRIRLRNEYGTDEFWSEYRAALETKAAILETATVERSLAWGIQLYRNSSAWAGLSNATRRARENIYRKVIGSAGHAPLAKITDAKIREGRELRSAKPHAANAFLKSMRAFFSWAVEQKLVPSDPTKGVKLLSGANDADGFHTWSEDELNRFEARWPVGTRERLAFDLLLYTGLRRGDAVRVGRQHVRDGTITIRTEKHRIGKPGELVSLPILPPLQESIAATKTGDLAFLVSDAGKPWIKESFGNWFRDVCREAGCPGSAHGLRKAGARRAAEHGATERQLMAIFGWTTSKQATHYTRAADRKRLAQDAAPLLMLGAQAENKTPAPSTPVRESSEMLPLKQEVRK